MVGVGGLLASASSLPAPQAPVGPPHSRPLPQTPPTHPRYPGPLGHPAWGHHLDVGSLLHPGRLVSHVLRGFPGGHSLWGAQERGSQLLLENRHVPGDPPSWPGCAVPPALSSPQAQVRVLVSQENPGQGRLRLPVVATTRTRSGQVQPGSVSPPRGPGLRSGQGGLAPLPPAGPGALTRPHRPEPPPKAGIHCGLPPGPGISGTPSELPLTCPTAARDFALLVTPTSVWLVRLKMQVVL